MQDASKQKPRAEKDDIPPGGPSKEVKASSTTTRPRSRPTTTSQNDTAGDKFYLFQPGEGAKRQVIAPGSIRAGTKDVAATANSATDYYDSCQAIYDDFKDRLPASGTPTAPVNVDPGATCGSTLKQLGNAGPPAGSDVVKVPRGVIVLEADKQTQAQQLKANKSAPAVFYVLEDDSELSGSDIKDPKQQFDQNTNAPNVTFDFTDKGKRAFSTVTKRIAQRGLHVAERRARRFAITLDEQIVSNASVDPKRYPEGIDGSNGAEISGVGSLQDAQDLANSLRIGALPIDLQLISKTQVSATLGQQALNQGLLAGAVGLRARPDLPHPLLPRARRRGRGHARRRTRIFLFALVKLFGVTLTLPGIAGLILTLGVAADANVVIFERIKEEARSGASIPRAITAGYAQGAQDDHRRERRDDRRRLHPVHARDLGRQGLRVHAADRHAAVAVHGGARDLGDPRLDEPDPDPALQVGAQPGLEGPRDPLRLLGQLALLLLDVGRDPGDLLVRDRDVGDQLRHRLRVRHAHHRAARAEGQRRLRCATRSASAGFSDLEIQQVDDPTLGKNVFQVQTKTLAPGDEQKVQNALDKRFGVIDKNFSSDSIGPTFGQTVAKTAVIAILASLFLISIYIGLRFEFKYAVPVLIALAHDLLITAGVYALFQREVTTSTVAALLTILGFSLYDTIIVFDRIRENVPRMPRATFSQIVNRSMSEVVVRSLVTSFSTLLPILALMLFGGATLKDFGFALLVGVASGAYSSIFIAAPVLTHWKEREPVYKRRTAAALQEHGGVIPAYADGSIADVEPAPGEKRGRRRIAPRPGSGGTPPREPATAGGPSPTPTPAPAPARTPGPAAGGGASTSTSGVSSAAAARRAARKAAAAEAASAPAESESADGGAEPSEGNGQAPEREARDPQAATDDKSSDKPINRRRKKHGRSR